MGKSILVAYATRFGSTQEVAEAIADTLKEEGQAVEVLPFSEVRSLDNYTAAILGSAVNYGSWLPDAEAFVVDHQEELEHLPVALFCVHITNTGQNEKNKAARHTFLDKVRLHVHAVDEAYFPGRFDKRGVKEMLPRWVAWAVPATNLIKWELIRTWAREVQPKLA